MIQILDINSKTLQKASNVLVESFRYDPLFQYIFNDLKHYEQAAPYVFTSWLRWGMFYGESWATENFESVALRKTLKKKKFGYWSLFRTGMFNNYKYLGKQAFARYMKVIELIEQVNKEILNNKPHWYAWIIGTLPHFRNKGFANALMSHTFARAAQDNVPIFLETYSKENVELHANHGYQLVKTRQVPESDLTVYFMLHPAEDKDKMDNPTILKQNS